MDLYLFARRLGEDPADTYDDLESEDGDARKDPAARERNDRLLDALQARRPDMRRHRQGRTVAFSIVSEWRSVSLVGDLLEIYLSRQYAVITADYERAGDPDRLAADIQHAVHVITTATGWRPFDLSSDRTSEPRARAG
jgi:hypothetical protein